MLDIRSIADRQPANADTVAAAAGGDIAAFAQLVALYHADMARVCAVICRDSDAAEDAVQAAWPIAWEKLRMLRDPGRVRPWLISIAANQARQFARRERMRQVAEIRATPSPIDSGDDDFSLGADIAIVLGGLSADERTLLALRYVAELDSGQIGRALGISASGARSRLERLVARLRTELADG